VNQADDKGRTPFFNACERGHLEIVKWMMKDERVDVNKEDLGLKTPFYVACEETYCEVVEWMIKDERVDITKAKSDGKTPLHIACFTGKFKIVELMMKDNRVDVNKADNYGTTPFYIVCQYELNRIADLMMKDDRVDVNKADSEGRTPLIGFFGDEKENRCPKFLKKLLKNKKLDVNKVDDAGYTPFHHCCETFDLSVLELMQEDERVKMNQMDAYGRTPLLLVCEYNQTDELTEVLHSLVEDRRIDLNKSKGKTFLDVLEERGDEEMIKFVRSQKRFGNKQLQVFGLEVKVSKEGSMDNIMNDFLTACCDGNLEWAKSILTFVKKNKIKSNKVNKVKKF
jgi:ankyrin repeat protein